MRRGARARGGRTLSYTMLMLIGIAVSMVLYLLVVFPSRAAPGRGREVLVVVSEGRSIGSLASDLEAARVVGHGWTFAIYARLIGADERLRSGELILSDDLTPREVLQRISIGLGSAAIDVMIPEGVHRFEIAARLERRRIVGASEFLAAATDPALLEELDIPGSSVEGYLFPDTYRLHEGIPAAEVIRRMVRVHRRRLEPLQRELAARYSTLSQSLGWGPHEVLTLASVVEKEAALPSERPLIARVFLNRLLEPTFVPHRLDADPTVSYGCLVRPLDAPSCASFRGRISRAMTHDSANLYNTYRHEGLPPGPICSPGLDSIRAVLAPAEHDYLFFVARGSRRHAFSRTIEEHNRTVARIRAPEALRGKP